MATTSRPVSILPGMGILALLPHLNYKPWYALGEFVDNAIQSYAADRKRIKAIDGRDSYLEVTIEHDPLEGGLIVVRDNAGGISAREYERAFKTAAPPADASGLSEFGIGMKSAACWFAEYWSVRSKAIDEDFETFIEFDVNKIVNEEVEVLDAQLSPADPAHHYTEVTLRELRRPLHGRTIGKIKDHLTGIYRVFIRDGDLSLRFNDDELEYLEPAILRAPYYKTPNAVPVEWVREVDIDLGGRKRIWGFAAIRQVGSTGGAGFAVFRRRRLIIGSGDEPYRPERLSKKPNSFTYQRLFGELNVVGFSVTHTKDALQWDDEEDGILDTLARELNDSDLPLLDQAEGYRARTKRSDVSAVAGRALDALASVSRALQRDVQAQRVGPVMDASVLPIAGAVKAEFAPFTRVLTLEIEDESWEITLEATVDPAVGDWLTVSSQAAAAGTRQLGIRLSLAHPFMAQFRGADAGALEPLLRVAVGLGLGEVMARDAGVSMAGAIRKHLNDLLRGALSEAGSVA